MKITEKQTVKLTIEVSLFDAVKIEALKKIGYSVESLLYSGYPRIYVENGYTEEEIDNYNEAIKSVINKQKWNDKLKIYLIDKLIEQVEEE